MNLYESFKKSLKEGSWEDALRTGKIVNLGGKENYTPTDFKYDGNKVYYKNSALSGNTWAEHPNNIDKIIDHIRNSEADGFKATVIDEETPIEPVDMNKVIDNDMTIKELDDTAQWLYDYDRDEWDKFTDNELIELAKLCQITPNSFGRAYDDEVFDEMDKRGLKLHESEEKKDEEVHTCMNCGKEFEKAGEGNTCPYCKSGNIDPIKESASSNDAIVEKALNYINNEYNEIGSDDCFFLKDRLTSKKSADAKIKDTLNYMINGYNELGGDDYNILYDILTQSGISIENNVVEPQNNIFNIPEEPKERKPRPITKKQQILDEFKNNLNGISIERGTGGSGNTIRFVPEGSRVGIKAYMRAGKDGDDFALSFNNTVAKQYQDKLEPLYNLAKSTYAENLGASFGGDFEFYVYDMNQINDISNIISSILLPKEGIKEAEEETTEMTIKESQSQEIESIMKDLRKDIPNIDKYIEEYYAEIAKEEPRPSYDKEKDEMNPEWEKWNHEKNNILYSEVAWKNFAEWVKNKYNENINESEHLKESADFGSWTVDDFIADGRYGYPEKLTYIAEQLEESGNVDSYSDSNWNQYLLDVSKIIKEAADKIKSLDNRISESEELKETNTTSPYIDLSEIIKYAEEYLCGKLNCYCSIAKLQDGQYQLTIPNTHEAVSGWLELHEKFNESEGYIEKLGGVPEDFISDIQSIKDKLNEIDTNSFGTKLAYEVWEQFDDTCDYQIQSTKDRFLNESYNYIGTDTGEVGRNDKSHMEHTFTVYDCYGEVETFKTKEDAEKYIEEHKDDDLYTDPEYGCENGPEFRIEEDDIEVNNKKIVVKDDLEETEKLNERDENINGCELRYRSSNPYIDSYYVYLDGEHIGNFEKHERDVKNNYYVVWFPKDYKMIESPNAGWETKSYSSVEEGISELKDYYEKSKNIKESEKTLAVDSWTFTE